VHQASNSWIIRTTNSIKIDNYYEEKKLEGFEPAGSSYEKIIFNAAQRVFRSNSSEVFAG